MIYYQLYLIDISITNTFVRFVKKFLAIGVASKRILRSYDLETQWFHLSMPLQLFHENSLKTSSLFPPGIREMKIKIN